MQRLSADGVTTPFPIQAATLPDSLSGRDVLGRGRTGSGKTLAFALPLVNRLAAGRRARPGHPTGLVLVPTRELAAQVAEVVSPLAESLGLRTTTIYGGVPEGRQIRALSAGVDIVIACPGRLQDLLNRGHVHLDQVRVTVLDEADHMADLGFLPVVRRLLDQTPREGQRLLFSATLDGGVDVLVKRFLSDPVRHEVDTASSTITTMDHHVLRIDRNHRVTVVADLAAAPGRTVVFTRTKRGAKTLARQLRSSGVAAVELHGDLAQGARRRNLEAFSSGTARALVATDVAARGIHVDDVTLVVHADPPVDHKAYLHRSGRTARAGESGTVVTLSGPEHNATVRTLMRRAQVQATTHRISGADDAVLRSIAPGERLFIEVPEVLVRQAQARPQGRGQARGQGAGSRRPRQAGTGQETKSGSSRGRRPRNGQARAATGAGSGSSRSHSAAAFSGSARGR